MVTIMKTFLITFIESVKIETANTNHNEGHILQDIKVTALLRMEEIDTNIYRFRPKIVPA
jgi:hypothetical protein